MEHRFKEGENLVWAYLHGGEEKRHARQIHN